MASSILQLNRQANDSNLGATIARLAQLAASMHDEVAEVNDISTFEDQTADGFDLDWNPSEDKWSHGGDLISAVERDALGDIDVTYTEVGR